MANMAPLTKRLVKGVGLTNKEGDDNWTTIENYVNALSVALSVSLSEDGSLKRPPVVRVASANGTDAYTVTGVPGTYASAADYAGIIFILRADVACNPSGAADRPTLSINGAAAIAIKKLKNIQPSTGDIQAGQEAILTYDPITGVFILHTPSTNARDNYAAASGTADYVISIANASVDTFEVPVAWYAGYTGKFKPASSLATSPATLNISSASPVIALGVKSLKKYTAAGKVALQVGDITADSVYSWVYDGTDVVLLNPNPDPIIYRGAAVAFTTAYNKPFDAVAHGLGGAPDFAHVILVNKANTAAGGYTVGDEVSALFLTPGVSAARPNPFVLFANAAGTTFTLVHTNPVAVSYYLVNAAGTTEQAYTDTQLAADWNVRVVLGRYKRAATGAAA